MNSNVNVGNCCAKCNHCGANVSSSKKATSNFRRHLQRKHPAIFNALGKPNPAVSITGQTVYQDSQPTVDTFAIKSSKWKVSEPHQIELNSAVVGLVANELLPHSKRNWN